MFAVQKSALLLVASLLLPLAIKAATVAQAKLITYRNWPQCWILDNGSVRAVIVPAIGRVVQFGFCNRPGVFWENDSMDGKSAVNAPWNNPGSFGGDKTWPAPQSEWTWPPPEVFDRTPMDCMPNGMGGVLLVSIICPRFGIRVERLVSLHPTRPQMRIVTTYHKVEGNPIEVSIWTLTQLREPLKTFLAIHPKSPLETEYTGSMDGAESFFQVAKRWISITRDPAADHTVGSDATQILWVGEHSCLKIDSPRISPARYPEKGAGVRVFTNGNPARFVEAQTLSPLQHLSVGDSLSATNTYSLFHRARRKPDSEAIALLK